MVFASQRWEVMSDTTKVWICTVVAVYLDKKKKYFKCTKMFNIETKTSESTFILLCFWYLMSFVNANADSN